MRGAISREDVVAVVGDVDRETIEAIIAIEPSRDELAATLAAVENELSFDDQHTEATTVRIAKLRALLVPIVATRTIPRGRD